MQFSAVQQMATIGDDNDITLSIYRQ